MVAGERKNNDDKGGQKMFLKHGMKRERDRKKEIEGMTWKQRSEQKNAETEEKQDEGETPHE